MKVVSGKLFHDDGSAVPFSPSPSQGPALVAPQLIVIHYTAGRGFEQSCAWLRNPKAKASAHLVIGAAGEIAQLVPFNVRAWHAGASEYSFKNRAGFVEEFTGLNAHSIAIELDNPGVLQRSAVGWRTFWGDPVGGDHVVLAEHKHGGGVRGWPSYPEKQILAAYAACEALIDAYPSIEDVIGHEDIAPLRKSDPGPAFPMESFRSWLLGRGAG